MSIRGGADGTKLSHDGHTDEPEHPLPRVEFPLRGMEAGVDSAFTKEGSSHGEAESS